jgi:type II secretory pathway pseudopilin PulG
MITLMLALALMTVALLAALPAIKQQITRDREEEMRHRGTAYMRAIQHYYKKLGRYPNSLGDLENTNNVRYLRKRYTDPMNRDPVTGKEKDFKLLHQQDITLNNGPVLGQTPGLNGAAPTFGAQSQLGGFQPSTGGPLSTQGGFGGQTGLGQQNGLGGQFGTNGNSTSGDSTSGGSAASPGSSTSTGSTSSASSGSDALSGQTFGGGPILGVASLSKAKSIRVFYDKSKYSDWLFVYVAQADLGGLLVGPVNPGAPTGNVGGLNPGQVAGATTGQGGFGQGGFGQSGFGQGGLQGSNGGGLNPTQPQAPPSAPQQQ